MVAEVGRSFEVPVKPAPGGRLDAGGHVFFRGYLLVNGTFIDAFGGFVMGVEEFVVSASVRDSALGISDGLVLPVREVIFFEAVGTHAEVPVL